MPTMKTICYDNGGKTVDRYTVFFPAERNPRNGLVAYLAMDDRPFHPQGFGQHGEGHPGRHNGRRIPLNSLPHDCLKLVKEHL